MLPGAIAYTYLGYAGRNAVTGREGIIRNMLMALGIPWSWLGVFAEIYQTFTLKACAHDLCEMELKQRLGRGDDALVLDVRSGEEYAGDLGHIVDP